VPLFLSGLVAAREGPLPGSAKAAPPRVALLPLVGCALVAPADAPPASPALLFRTAAAEYGAAKPAAAYKPFFEPASQAAASVRLVESVLLGGGGEAAQRGAELKEVAARLARSAGASLSAAKALLLRDSALILARLAAADAKAFEASKGKGGAQPLLAGPFGQALKAEAAAAAAAAARPANVGGGIVIRDAAGGGGAAAGAEPQQLTSTSAAQMSADEALAQSINEGALRKAAAKAKKTEARQAAIVAGPEAYIKIAESELAAEYPEPKEYAKGEEEEMDELLMGDMDDDSSLVHPDDLPKRLLNNFAIYKDDGAPRPRRARPRTHAPRRPDGHAGAAADVVGRRPGCRTVRTPSIFLFRSAHAPGPASPPAT